MRLVPHETKHWIALSLALPEYVHLETVTRVRVDHEFLANHGFGPELDPALTDAYLLGVQSNHCT